MKIAEWKRNCVKESRNYYKKKGKNTRIQIQKKSTRTLGRMKRGKGSGGGSSSTEEMPYEIVCPQCRLTVFHFYDETQFSTVLYCMPDENVVYARIEYLYIRYGVHRERECKWVLEWCAWGYAVVNILE